MKKGYEYRYVMLEQLPDINVDSSKHEPVLCVDVSNVDVNIMKEESNEGKGIQLSFRS